MVGRPWTPDMADRWLDLIDRRDIDRFVKVWKDAHQRGIPLLAGCRVRWPNGMDLTSRATATPRIVNRQLEGLTGMTQFYPIE